jgi:hypothetical protein
MLCLVSGSVIGRARTHRACMHHHTLPASGSTPPKETTPSLHTRKARTMPRKLWLLLLASAAAAAAEGGSMPATTSEFHSGSNLLRRLYSTRHRYAYTSCGPSAMPSSARRSSVVVARGVCVCVGVWRGGECGVRVWGWGGGGCALQHGAH